MFASRLEYAPFGQVVTSVGTTPEHTFTGQRSDSSTGLMYYRARYYDPEFGRFITPDTFVQSPADPQTLNRYAYVRNNPVKYVDPSGHFFGFIAKIIGAVLGFLFGGVGSGGGGSLASAAASSSRSGLDVGRMIRSSAIGTLTGVAVNAARGRPLGRGALVGGATGLLTGSAFSILDPGGDYIRAGEEALLTAGASAIATSAAGGRRATHATARGAVRGQSALYGAASSTAFSLGIASQAFLEANRSEAGAAVRGLGLSALSIVGGFEALQIPGTQLLGFAAIQFGFANGALSLARLAQAISPNPGIETVPPSMIHMAAKGLTVNQSPEAQQLGQDVADLVSLGGNLKSARLDRLSDGQEVLIVLDSVDRLGSYFKRLGRSLGL